MEKQNIDSYSPDTTGVYSPDPTNKPMEGYICQMVTENDDTGRLERRIIEKAYQLTPTAMKDREDPRHNGLCEAIECSDVNIIKVLSGLYDEAWHYPKAEFRFPQDEGGYEK